MWALPPPWISPFGKVKSESRPFISSPSSYVHTRCLHICIVSLLLDSGGEEFMKTTQNGSFKQLLPGSIVLGGGEALPWSCTCTEGGWWSRRSDASYSGWGPSRSGRHRPICCPRPPSPPAARAWKSKPRVHDFPLSRNFSLVTAEGGRASKTLRILQASSFPGRWKVWFECLSCHSPSQVGVRWDFNPSKHLLAQVE